jgi:hypothetical protein
MMKSKDKFQLWAARFDADDARRIKNLSQRLGLNVADVIRRATHVGLVAFDDAKLPDMLGSEGAANDQTASTDQRDDSRTRFRAAPSWEQRIRFSSFDFDCQGRSPKESIPQRNDFVPDVPLNRRF